MKAEELMIGDWVLCEGPSNVTIQTIAADGVWFNGEEFEGAASYDRISPIPLTPEILEENGFKKEGSWFVIEDDYYDVSIKEITDSIWRVKYCNTEFSAFDCVLHVAFVHQLQHALKLCGIEKEIVI